MKVLFCGDIVGRAGRDAVIKEVPRLRRELGLDFVAVNGENAAASFGITAKICAELHEAGVDCITTGNHVWDQREIVPYIAQDKRLLRPVNYPPGTPGWGANLFQTARGQKVVVINVMGRLFMDALDDPFRAVDARARSQRWAAPPTSSWSTSTARRPARSNRSATTRDGRVSAVLGTHSHVPTSDCWILPGGTAYQTDVGMCGDYDWVIGMKKDRPCSASCAMPGERLSPAEGEGTLCAAVVETDDRTGLAASVRPIRLGGRLSQAV